MNRWQHPAKLPIAVSTLVGRQRERAEVSALVARDRLVTLTGSGGCGKSRLALEVARDIAPGFPNGARWVELSGAGDPDSIMFALADAVGVREEPGRALDDTLVDELRAWRGMVVLDNGEHLIDACATLVRKLLGACEHVHVLVTSRQPLTIDGETTWQVPPLGVPEHEQRSVAAVAASEAVNLFVTRARQVTPDFVLTDGNVVAVAEICRRLDGIPLALELAAARMRVLSVEQIVAGLADRFRVLTSSVRGAPSRQATLEASVTWSFNLLNDAQRLALARMSVFAGSFDLHAARAIVSGSTIDETAVLDLISALADRSLVQVDARRPHARYRLLETIRLYAAERLAELDDPDRLGETHLAYCVDLAGRARTGLASSRPETWIARLAADLDDLRAAMDRAAASGNLAELVNLTEPIVRFWFERGLAGEVHRRLLAAVDAAHADGAERVRGLLTAATLAAGTGSFADACRLATRIIDTSHGLTAAPQVLPTAIGVRAWAGAWSALSTNDQIAADADEAVRLAEQVGDASTTAYVLLMVGGALFVNRSIDAGSDLLERAVEVCSTEQLVFQAPSVHATLGWWLASVGRVEEASHHAQRGLELSRQVARPVWEVYGLMGLGAIALLKGRHIQAHEQLSHAQALLRRRGLEGTLPDLPLRRWLAWSAYNWGDLATARATAAKIVTVGRGGGSRWDEANGKLLLGVLDQVDGHHDDARAHLEAVKALSTDPPMPFVLGRALAGLAQLAEHAGESDEAWDLAHASLETMHDYGDRLGTVSALETIAGLAAAAGDPQRAMRLLAACERFHLATGTVRMPQEATRFARACDAARAALDPPEAASSWQSGDKLSLQEAVAYARRGRGERQRPEFGWGALTPVEHDVVRLVAQGHTNAEIGRRLFISVNTVKYHLTHVYAKLTLDNRTELAAQAARRSL